VRQRCGLLPRDPEAPGFPAQTNWPVDSPSACPGYLVTLPQVLEGARALAWKDNLVQRYEGLEPTGLVMDAIDIVQSSISEVESAMLAKGK